MKATCRKFHLPLAAYADDELGVDAALEVERHLEECGACRRALGRQRHLMRAVRVLHPTAEPPASFEARVRHAVLGPTPALRVRVASLIGVALLALGAIGGWLARSDAPGPGHDARPASGAAIAAVDPAPAAAAAATLHRNVVSGALPLGIASHDVTAVNAWLHSRLPFAGTNGASGSDAIGTPGSDAIALEGAALVTLDDRPAGLVRYRTGDRDVSLFVLHEPPWTEQAAPVRVGNVDFRIFQRGGLDLVGWSHDAVSYLLVSEGGLTTGDGCAACHDARARGSIADFVAAVAGHTSGT